MDQLQHILTRHVTSTTLFSCYTRALLYRFRHVMYNAETTFTIDMVLLDQLYPLSNTKLSENNAITFQSLLQKP
jgi:hypothetical protein